MKIEIPTEVLKKSFFFIKDRLIDLKEELLFAIVLPAAGGTVCALSPLLLPLNIIFACILFYGFVRLTQKADSLLKGETLQKLSKEELQSKMIHVFFVSLISGFAIALAASIFVIPGFFVLPFVAFAPVLAVTHNLNISDTFTKSFELSRNIRMKIFMVCFLAGVTSVLISMTNRIIGAAVQPAIFAVVQIAFLFLVREAESSPIPKATTEIAATN